MNIEQFEMNEWSISFNPGCLGYRETVKDSLDLYPLLVGIPSCFKWAEQMIVLYLTESMAINGHSIHGAGRIVRPAKDIGMILSFAESLHSHAIVCCMNSSLNLGDFELEDRFKEMFSRLDLCSFHKRIHLLDLVVVTTTGLYQHRNEILFPKQAKSNPNETTK